MKGAGGWALVPCVHGLNPLIALSGWSGDVRMDGAERYPSPSNRPTILADMKLVPGMCFAPGPNYAFGWHLAYIGGTVLVGQDEAIELNRRNCYQPWARVVKYIAQEQRQHTGTKIIRTSRVRVMGPL